MIRGYDSGYDSEILNVLTSFCIHINLCRTNFAVKVFCALWSGYAVAAVRAAVRMVCAVWGGHAGAVGVPLQGAGAGCCMLSQWCVQFGVEIYIIYIYTCVNVSLHPQHEIGDGNQRSCPTRESCSELFVCVQ